MAVTIECVKSEDLETKIQERKDEGRRILALSPSKLKKTGLRTYFFEVIEYTLVTQ